LATGFNPDAAGRSNLSGAMRICSLQTKKINCERCVVGWAKIGLSQAYRNVYYLTPKIRVPLRAKQAQAKRANAKK